MSYFSFNILYALGLIKPENEPKMSAGCCEYFQETKSKKKKSYAKIFSTRIFFLIFHFLNNLQK